MISLTIDILHTWFLGIHQRFLGWVWWRMLEDNLFQFRVASAEALIQEGIIRLRTSLFLFCRLNHEENPAEEFPTLGDLSEKTLGQRSGSQSLRCKGAETRLLVPFSIWLFKKNTLGFVARRHHADGSGSTGVHGQHSARCTDEHEQCRDADGPWWLEASFPCDGFAGHESGAKASFVHSLDPQYSIALKSTDIRSLPRQDRCACHRMVFYKRVLAEFRIAHGPESEGRKILDKLRRRRAI